MIQIGVADNNLVQLFNVEGVEIGNHHEFSHVTGLIKLHFTGLGRALKTEAQERSCIRRVDRFLCNKRVQKDRVEIYKTICRLIVGLSLWPLIIVDWSTIPDDCLLLMQNILYTRSTLS